MIGDDDSVSLYYADNCPWGTENESHQHVTNDANWVQGRRGENGITAYVDVHNKQFNFKLMKMQMTRKKILKKSRISIMSQIRFSRASISRSLRAKGSMPFI